MTRKPWQQRSASSHITGSRRGREARTRQLAEHPTCQWPQCHQAASEVDHITPISRGGNPWDRHNHQSLCKTHHDQKTATERQHAARAKKTRQRAAEPHPGAL